MALTFEEDLKQLLNRHSAEAPSGTPDYILADFITGCLKQFNETVGARAEHRNETVERAVYSPDEELSAQSETDTLKSEEEYPAPVPAMAVLEDNPSVVNVYAQGKNSSIINLYY